MDENKLLTTKEAAKIVGCSTSYLARLIRKNRLAAVKMGGVYLIKRGDLDNIKAAKRGRGRPPKDATES